MNPQALPLIAISDPPTVALLLSIIVLALVIAAGVTMRPPR